MASDHKLAHNPDLALHESREHHHEHLHHSARAEEGRTDDIHYTKGTTDEPGVIPKADLLDDHMHKAGHPERNGSHTPVAYEKDIKAYDAEKGSVSPAHTDREEEADPQRHRVARFYRKYRIVFHLVLAALFTGYVYRDSHDPTRNTHEFT